MSTGWHCPRCGDLDEAALALYREGPAFNAYVKRVGPWCRACGSRAAFDVAPEERLAIGAGHPTARVLVLSGTCASGKSTLSYLLSERHGLAQIDGDWILSYYKHELGVPVAFDVINDDLLSMAAGLAAMGRSSVIAHVVLPEYLAVYDSYLTACGLPHRLVVLAPSMPVLLERNRTRTCWPKPTPEHWIRTFADDLLAAPGVAGSLYYDNSLETEEETAARLWLLLNASEPTQSGLTRPRRHLMSNVTYVPTPYSYSSAVVAGDYVFLGLHRGSGDTFAAQLEDAFRYLAQTLAKIGLTVHDIVKVSVWLKNVRDLPEMEKMFASYFEADHFPARMTATTEFIDDDCLLMIEGVAYKGK